jgi:tetratricopeptide (TPR) repeat protein
MRPEMSHIHATRAASSRRVPAAAALAALALALACATPSPRLPPLPTPAPPPAALPEIPPVDAAAELAAGRTAAAAGDLAAARAHLEAALRADASLLDARLELAAILLGDPSALAAADGLLAEARLLRWNDARLARLEGVSREVHGDDTGAVEAYARALALSPDPDLALRRGILLRRLGRADDAIAALEVARDARPADRMARAHLAELYEARRRPADAERELGALVELARGEPGPLRRLADFYRRHGRARRARELDADAARLETAPRVLRPLRPASR